MRAASLGVPAPEPFLYILYIESIRSIRLLDLILILRTRIHQYAGEVYTAALLHGVST